MAIDNQFGKGIGLAAGFDLGAQKPLDSRIAVNTIAERDTHVTENRAYEGMIVFVDETKKNYQLLNGVWVELFKDEQDRLDSLEAELRGEGEGSEGGALATLQANINTVQDNLNDEKERAEQVEAGLQDAIDAINNAENGILAQAKALDKTDRDAQLLVDQEQDRRLKALENANAEGGAVKEAIDQVQANLDAFEAEQATKEAAQDAEDARLDQAIKDEAVAARAAEQANATAINNEKTRAESAEAGLNAAIEAEAGRAAGKENELDQAIKAEAATARAAEKANADEIAKQKDAAQEGTLANQIKVEKEARIAADNGLDERLQAVEASVGDGGDLEKRVQANEDAINVINGNGEGSIKKAVADLVNGAPEALDTLDELAGALRDNKDVLTAIETAFDGKLATLQADVDQNEADCDAAIKAEKERAEGQEAAIRGEFAAADTKLKSDLQAEIDADVKVEKERAEAAEKAINDEIANMKNADLDGSLANLIADEAARADAAEKANASAIASNTSNIADNRSVLDKLDGSVTTEGSVKKQIKDAVDGITTGDGSIGARLTAVESKNIEQDAAITTAQSTANQAAADIATEKARAEAAEKINSDAIGVLNGDITVAGSVDKKIADNNVFNTDILTINELGGISAGTDLNGLTVEEVLKKLLYPYVEPTISAAGTPNGGTYESGNNQTITNVKVVVGKKSEQITKVEVFNGTTSLGSKQGSEVSNGGTFNFAVSVPVDSKDVQLTAKATDASGKIVSANTGKFNFVYPYYCGVCTDGAEINEAMVKGLTKKVEGKASSKLVTYTTDFQRAVFAYPASYGNIKKILDPNSFEVTNTFTRHLVDIVGLDGKKVAYNVYVNNAFTATGFKFTFSY